MILTAAFNPWTIFVDVGIISILLLIGKLLRVKVKFVQRYFIPPSLLAGFLGLALGPGGMDILPLSDQMGTYSSILIAFIFGCLPFSSSTQKNERSNIMKMWAYSQTGMLWQWAFGGLFGIFVLGAIWSVNPAFGISMPSGYCGGHGTAAAIGQAFAQMGYDDMLTLAMTAATVGIVSAVFIGLLMIKWGTRKGYTTFLANFSDLPDDLRTGLLPADKRESMGNCTTSSISIDSLSLNFAFIAMIALMGYGISELVSYFVPSLQMPVFSCAFIAGILTKQLCNKVNTTQYICPKTVGHLSGVFTDLLVAFGISAIKLEVVIQYWMPLTLLLVVGLVVTMIYIIFFARRLMKDNFWFEKALFTWGWYTGTMAMGIALLRVVDPKMRSHCLEDYGLAYLAIAPVEISLITFAPVAFCNGYGVHFLLLALLVGCLIMGFAYFKGWLKKA